MGVFIVSKALSRKRFLSIKLKIYFVDNMTLDGSNKMTKVETVSFTLNASFIKYGIFHDRLSIDELMVSYYGWHSCKMFIHGKPIWFGYKLCGLCGHDGYPYKLNIYTGKCETHTEILGSFVVNTMVNFVIENFLASTPHFILTISPLVMTF